MFQKTSESDEVTVIFRAPKKDKQSYFQLPKWTDVCTSVTNQIQKDGCGTGGTGVDPWRPRCDQIRSHFLRRFGSCVITIQGVQIVPLMETHRSHSCCRRSLVDMSMCRSPGGPCTIPGSYMGLSRTDSHLRELGTLLNNAQDYAGSSQSVTK